ncbi:response regulator [Brachybacterium hainanense]|uniref:Response regulator n=1 Tax=Brachybacterium hainanense TaxID=1541174 RepID=A0ABV6R9C5_9MICO
MIRVLVVDDQDLVRAGVVATLATQEDLQVVGEAADGAQAVRASARTQPDVVLLDVRMPVLDGIAATHRILQAAPRTRILVLTTFDADELVHAALRAGACGYLVKDAPVAELVGAVRAAARGDSVLSPAITARLVEQLLAAPPPAAADTVPEAATSLTEREIEIVRLLADGLSNAEIGASVHLSEATVKTHVGRVLAKLGLRDRLQVAVWAHRTGLARPAR